MLLPFPVPPGRWSGVDSRTGRLGALAEPRPEHRPLFSLPAVHLLRLLITCPAAGGEAYLNDLGALCAMVPLQCNRRCCSESLTLFELQTPYKLLL